jgi:hypothetical protein
MALKKLRKLCVAGLSLPHNIHTQVNFKSTDAALRAGVDGSQSFLQHDAAAHSSSTRTGCSYLTHAGSAGVTRSGVQAGDTT